MKSDETYVQIVKCHFDPFSAIWSRKVFSKIILIIYFQTSSRLVLSGSNDRNLIFVLFLHYFNVHCFKKKSIKTYQFLWHSQKLSLSSDEYVPRYELLNLTKHEGGCTQNVIVQWKSLMVCNMQTCKKSIIFRIEISPMKRVNEKINFPCNKQKKHQHLFML